MSRGRIGASRDNRLAGQAGELIKQTNYFPDIHMDYHFDFLERLVEKGGPDAEDFYNLDAWIAETVEKTRKGGWQQTT